MNNLNFGLYIEDILIRIMNGDEDSLAMLLCTFMQGRKEKSMHGKRSISNQYKFNFYRIHMDVTA